ncbi:MAG TPA: SDR family oxidoreductase [Armatimonadota bacterium]|jgi:gluconate 5-dehydrogenase
MDMFRLDGKCALITGGSRGIGFGIARGLAEAGSDLVLVARKTDSLDAAKERLQDTGRRISTYSFDMEDTGEIAHLYSQIIRESGGVDILVNNAGVTHRVPSEELRLEDWQLVIDVNLTAVFAISQAFARERIKTSKKGKIINIASLMSEQVRPHNAPYAASKGGIRQLTKALAVDWASHGINVNALGPGYIRTDLTETLWQDEEFDAWVLKRTPMGRWGMPADLAAAAVFLASPASDFITGQTIYVDGGWLAQF